MNDSLNSEIDKMVAAAQEGKSRTDKIKAVHDYLKNKVTYRRQYQIPDTESDKRNYVYDIYGSLVNSVSVCDGFSKGFQVAMNRLGIPSVQVPGDALDENGNAQSHSWNVVQLEDKVWYLVDVTYDTTGGVDAWLLANQIFTANTHFPNGQLDSNPVTFYFPPAPVPGADKWAISYVYYSHGGLFGPEFSFENKNYSALLAEGYRYVTKFVRFNKEGVLSEDPWRDVRQKFTGMGAIGTEDKNATFSQDNVDNSVYSIQLGVAHKDVEFFRVEKEEVYSGVNDSEVVFKTSTILTNYTMENLTMFENMNKPGVQYFSPTNRRFFPGYEYAFVFSMTEELMSNVTSDRENEYSNFSITLTAKSLNHYDRNKGIAEKVGEDAVKMTVLRDVSIINNKTIAATITPSNSYAHDYMDYTFHFNGLIGIFSQQEVKPFTFTVQFFPNNGGTNTCSKMMGQGTVYVAGRPVLISDGDIRNGGSNDNFEAVASNGTVISGKGATSSDIALVATRRDDDSSEPYTASFDLALSLYCRDYFIKPGKWNCPLTVQLPFPDGFDPNENKDVTFEVVHYKEDGSILETNTVVVGPTGLLITVNSFSPFKIQPKKKSAIVLAPEDIEYPLFTSCVGGSPIIKIGEKKITNVITTYKLNQEIVITMPEGSRVEKICLNGKQFEISKYNGFTLPANLLNERSNNLDVFLATLNVLNKEFEEKVSPFYITATVASKSQSKEGKELTTLLTQSAGSPELPPGVSNDGNKFVVDSPLNNPDEITVSDDDVPDEKDLPKYYPPEEPKENPNIPTKPNIEPDEPSEPDQEPGDSGSSGDLDISGDSGNSGDSGDSGDNKPSGSDGGKKPLSTGAIIGIVVGVIAAVAIVIILVYFFVIKPKKLHESSGKAEEEISNVKNDNDSAGI